MMRTYPRRDTSPEIRVRSALHARGLRYRVCLPVPDLRRRTIDVAFTRTKVAVFVDGCFWHGCTEHLRPPRVNAAWWEEKVRRNRARDAETNKHLIALGWQVLRHWEHEEAQPVAEAVELVVRSRRAQLSSGIGLPRRSNGFTPETGNAAFNPFYCRLGPDARCPTARQKSSSRDPGDQFNPQVCRCSQRH